MVVWLFLAVAVALGAPAPQAFAAGASTTRATTTPSLTRSFPLGRHRLHRSAAAGSGSAPVGHVPPSPTDPASRSSQPARSVTSGPSVAWILILLGAIGLTAVVSCTVQRRVMRRAALGTRTVSEPPVAQATADALPEPDPVKFLLYQDNGGGYYWTIVDGGGDVLARSVGFASYPEANYTADMVHRAAGTAMFENRTGTSPPGRPLASADGESDGDQADTEPPSESDGSVSREEVTRRARATRAWPAGSSSTPGGRRR